MSDSKQSFIEPAGVRHVNDNSTNESLLHPAEYAIGLVHLTIASHHFRFSGFAWEQFWRNNVF